MSYLSLIQTYHEMRDDEAVARLLLEMKEKVKDWHMVLVCGYWLFQLLACAWSEIVSVWVTKGVMCLVFVEVACAIAAYMVCGAYRESPYLRSERVCSSG